MIEVVIELFAVIGGIGGVGGGLLRARALRKYRPPELLQSDGTHYCPRDVVRSKKYINKLWFCPQCPRMWTVDVRSSFDGRYNRYNYWRRYEGSPFTFFDGAERPGKLLFLYCGTHDKEAVGCLGCLDHHHFALRCGLLPFHAVGSCGMCNYLLLSPSERSWTSYSEGVVRQSPPIPVDVTESDTAEVRNNQPLRTAGEPSASATSPKVGAERIDLVRLLRRIN